MLGICHPANGAHIGTAVDQSLAERVVITVNGLAVYIFNARAS